MRNPGDAYETLTIWWQERHDGYRTPATHFSQIH